MLKKLNPKAILAFFAASWGIYSAAKAADGFLSQGIEKAGLKEKIESANISAPVLSLIFGVIGFFVWSKFKRS